MFCSQTCREEAWNKFHNFECPIAERILKSGVMQIAMRIFFQALNVFDGSVEDLQSYLRNCDNSSVSVFDFDFSTATRDESERLKNSLASLWCLVKNENIDENDSPERILKDHLLLGPTWIKHEKFISTFIRKIV